MTYALVDINNAYCSFIQLFAGLQGRPVAVLSSNQGNVVSRNYEVKALGIKMGQPAHEVMGLIRHHGGTVYGSNFALFGSLSDRFHQELEMGGWMYDCQVYSVDETFGRVDARLMGNLEIHGRKLQATIQRNLGLGVGVGIGPSHTIAKAANWCAKEQRWKDFTRGVVDLSDPARQERLFRKMPIGEIWGIGPRLSPKLEAIGIKTALQLRDANPRIMRDQFGLNVEKTILELRGEDVIALKDADVPRETICVSRSMGSDIADLGILKEALSHHSAVAARKLRDQHSMAGAISVFIGTNPFSKALPQYHNSATIKLPVPSQSTEEIAANALYILTQIFREGFKYRKVGVILGAISDVSIQQGDMFTADQAELSPVSAVLDQINDKFGRNALRMGRGSSTPDWKPNDDLKPPSYTTCWDQIPTAK